MQMRKRWRIMASKAVLTGMGIAKDVIPGMHEQMILHAGPPVDMGAHVRPDTRRGNGRADL